MATDMRATRAAGAPPAPSLSGLPRDGAPHFRGDIEGLRAVAVLLVIADHLFGWPHGGFIGVDVFFVISGFLITGLLLREHREHGRISFTDFYKRRIRRILPASVLVLVVTALAAHVVFFGARARATVDDALWALLFAGNWNSALDGTDYQQAEGPVSPVQHYWSLSVEEQFYVVWPVVLAVVLGLAGWRRRHRHKSLTAIAAVTGLVVVAGYAWALHETTTNPTWAYFATSSRAWELGVGALLAVVAPAAARIPARLRPVLGWAGLAGIVAGALLIDSTSPFPAPSALLPVVSTAVVIAAGTGGQSSLHLLTNPVARRVGALSYSLYLWHFPAIVVLAVLVPPSAAYYALVLGVTVVGSLVSYHLVEQPIRRSSWLRPGAVWPRERHVARFGGWVVTVGAAALVAVLVVLPATGSGWPWRQDSAAAAATSAPAELPPPDGPQADAEAAAAAEDELSGDITAALEATEWPELYPSLDAPDEELYAPEWLIDDCLNIESEADADRCVYGDPTAPRTAVLLGDSVSISYLPGIRRALDGAGWQIRVLTLGQCPQIAATELDGYAGYGEYCAAHQQFVIEQVQLIRPDLLILSSAANSVNRLASSATGEAALAEWRQGLADTLAAFDTAAPRLVLLGTPPEVENLAECATRFNGPQDCVGSIEDWVDGLIRAERETVTRFRGAMRATYVDTRPWFCDAQGRCPPFVGATPVFADGVHLTAAYSERLGVVLRPVLLGG